MKLAISLAFLLSATVLNTVYASEEMTSGNIDVPVYCEEQAQLAGIEEANEKNQYIQECIDSFGLPEEDESASLPEVDESAGLQEVDESAQQDQ
jgi:hypothetical protein